MTFQKGGFGLDTGTTSEEGGFATSTALAVLVLGISSIAQLQGSHKTEVVQEPALDDLPEIHYSVDPDREWPEFVSAKAALSWDGSVAPDLFDPVSQEILENLRSQPPTEDNCQLQEETHEGVRTFRDRSKLAAAVANSPLVVHGRVNGKKYGFTFGVAGHLVRIEALDGFGSKPPLERYLFFVPVGRFEAGPYTICKTDSRYPGGELEVGDEVVVVVPEHRVPDEPFLLLDDFATLIVLRPGSPPLLPVLYRKEAEGADHAASSDQLLEWIRGHRGEPH